MTCEKNIFKWSLNVEARKVMYTNFQFLTCHWIIASCYVAFQPYFSYSTCPKLDFRVWLKISTYNEKERKILKHFFWCFNFLLCLASRTRMMSWFWWWLLGDCMSAWKLDEIFLEKIYFDVRLNGAYIFIHVYTTRSEIERVARCLLLIYSALWAWRKPFILYELLKITLKLWRGEKNDW